MNKIEYKNGEVVVYNGDCFELIKNLKSQGIKVNTIVTDPPYNLLKGNDKHSKAVETNVDWGLFCKETYDLLEENSFFGYFQMFKSAMKSNWFNLTTDAGYEVKTELIWDKKQASDFLSSFP